MDKKEIYEKEMQKFSRTLKDILDMNGKKSAEVFEVKLYSPDCKAITDWFDSFDINTVPEKVRARLYKSYDEDYLCGREWLDEDDTIDSVLQEAESIRPDGVLMPVDIAMEHIAGMLNAFDPVQFRKVVNNRIESVLIDNVPEFWIEPCCGYVPDTGSNIRIIDKMMTDDGYIRVRTSRRRDREGRSWFIVVYNPDPKFGKDIREIMRRKELLHFSLEFNRDSIIESGLVPSYGGRTYLYPDKRVFFYIQPEPHMDFIAPFREMMRGISRKTKREVPDFSGLFDMWRLKQELLPDDARMFYDPNARNCVFMNIHIEPEWLEFVRNGATEF